MDRRRIRRLRKGVSPCSTRHTVPQACPRRSMSLVGHVHARSGHKQFTSMPRQRPRQARRAASALGGSTTSMVTAEVSRACSNRLPVPPFRPRRSMPLVGHVHATGGHERVTFMHRERPRQDRGAASALGGSTTCAATLEEGSACSNHLTVPPSCSKRSMWLVGHVHATGAHH